jgi:hypothetical protein
VAEGSAESRRSPNYRIAVAAVWVILQIALVVTADGRPDGAFGFRMFAESASLKIVLQREVKDASANGNGSPRVQKVHVDGGLWSARGTDGVVRKFGWYDRVPFPVWVFDQEMHASYGSATQLSRLQAALDDVSAHISEDDETQRLLLTVTIRKNGHEPVTTQLSGPPRAVHGVEGRLR